MLEIRVELKEIPSGVMRLRHFERKTTHTLDPACDVTQALTIQSLIICETDRFRSYTLKILGLGVICSRTFLD